MQMLQSDKLAVLPCYLTIVGWATLPLLLVFLLLSSMVYSSSPLLEHTSKSPVANTVSQHPNEENHLLRTSLRKCLELTDRSGWEKIPGHDSCRETRIQPNSCGAPKVWIAARKHCEKAGTRLCTSAEVLAGAAHGIAKCAGPDTTVWTHSRCGMGANYLIEFSDGRTGAEIMNVSKPSAGGTRNCEESGHTHRAVCCADS